MKKLIYTLLAFATVCFSCVQDVDDVSINLLPSG